MEETTKQSLANAFAVSPEAVEIIIRGYESYVVMSGDVEGWLVPGDFLRDFNRADNASVMLRKGKKFREGFLIAQLCLLKHAERFRLPSTEDFDGQYVLGNQHPLVEVTELLDEGRKRNLEYAPDGPNLTSMPFNTENICQRIHDAVRKKNQKKMKFRDTLSDPIELLIYLNLHVFRNVERDVRIGLDTLPEHCFDSVHILIGTHILMSRNKAGEVDVVRKPISVSDF